ncbi:MAG: hypothetical protein OHK006_11040 [Thermodesulfovibrionales bacterium]
MCEFCTKHGDGKVWYKNSANYAQDLVADLNRRRYISGFFEHTIQEGFETLGRLETIFRKKGRLPEKVRQALLDRARTEHFGQVLPIEEIRTLVLKAAAVVRMPCACRWATDRKELRCCYGISFGPEHWYRDIDMGYFGIPPHAGLETLSRDEAVRQMERMEERGAIHTIWTLMTPFIGSVCNCSLGDCLALRTITGIGVETMARAESVAQVDESICTGCGLCAERCQFRAVSAKKNEAGSVSVIDPHACFGCGLCRNSCAERAILLVPRAWGHDNTL